MKREALPLVVLAAGIVAVLALGARAPRGLVLAAVLPVIPP